ncbi:MAG: hypothetical protein BAJALOKI1v1_350001 [Promethearchaeota archaeon]|nr:MAG: hypothetical protein BAJALOKI1v1_350001 [Candidatus Lokiarchaeota archaeon]
MHVETKKNGYFIIDPSFIKLAKKLFICNNSEYRYKIYIFDNLNFFRRKALNWLDLISEIYATPILIKLIHIYEISKRTILLKKNLK